MNEILEVEDFLQHHGVRGMHWGVRRHVEGQRQAHINRLNKIASGTASRNDRGAVRRRSGTITTKSANRELRRADKKWGKGLVNSRIYFTVHNHAADKMNNGLIAKFNARSEFKNMKGESDPRYGKYVSDYEKLFAKTMDESLREMGGGISPSGRFTAKVHRNPGGLPTIVIRDSQIQHAAGDMPMEFSYKLVVDKNGYITSVKKDGFSMAQSTVLEVEDFLSHHGVRGQKWGVRNKRQFFKKGVRGDFHYRTGGQKTGLIAGGVAGWMTGGVAAQAMLKHFGQNPVTGLAALGTQIGVSVAGVRLARGFMDRHGRDHMSAARKKYTQKQAIRQVKQHLKNNPGG